MLLNFLRFKTVTARNKILYFMEFNLYLGVSLLCFIGQYYVQYQNKIGH